MSVRAWVTRQNMQYQKHDVAAWGSYTLVASYDGGRTWAQMAERCGWGWREQDAFTIQLENMLARPEYHGQLQQWLGIVRFKELQDESTKVDVTNTLPVLYGAFGLP